MAVYIHWPYCARICPYCDFNVVRDRKQAEQSDLAEAIVRDLEGQAALMEPRSLVSIFFGGGTPSLMDPTWTARIIETARRLWPSGGPVEITLEANPTDAEAARFTAFSDAGVNRLSLGVQAFDDQALRLLGRNHDAGEAGRAAALARSHFAQLSLDLIYALPGQTPATWRAEIAKAMAFAPDHLSPYQLTIEAGTAFDRAVRRGTLRPPGPDDAAALYETTQTELGRLGFDAYEVSNHARTPAARSRHNLAYWRGQDYVGAGPGAHGRLTIHGAREATYAASKVGGYIEAVRLTGLGFASREPLTLREAALERLLMGLRTDEGVALADLAPLQIAPVRLRSVVEQELASLGADRLIITPKGRPVLDWITAQLAR